MKFFKKIGYSIGKIEKYAEMATDGVKSALLYLAGITVILTIVFCLGSVYKTHQSVQSVAGYIETEIPEFSYKDGKLSMDGEQPLIIENDEIGFDKIIIDVQDKTDEEIEQYKKTIKESGNGILILKDKVQMIAESTGGEVTYALNDIVTQLGMNEFSKADVINYLRGEIKITNEFSEISMDLKKENYYNLDFSEVKGQETAKRALEIAAARST